MICRFGKHRVYDCQKIGLLSNMGEQFADMKATLTTLLEFPVRATELPYLPKEDIRLFLGDQILAMSLDQFRLVIK